jgi:hypothetical protein
MCRDGSGCAGGVYIGLLTVFGQGMTYERHTDFDHALIASLCMSGFECDRIVRGDGYDYGDWREPLAPDGTAVGGGDVDVVLGDGCHALMTSLIMAHNLCGVSSGATQALARNRDGSLGVAPIRWNRMDCGFSSRVACWAC